VNKATSVSQPDRGVWTVPNAISLLRCLLVPLFAYLVIRHHDVWAVAVLVFSGVTDWLDGVAARKLNQFSKVGALLDPAVDRVMILVTVILLLWRGIVPLWVVALLLAREIAVGLGLVVLKTNRINPPAVVFVGKAATLALMYAFPALLLSEVGRWVGSAAFVAGWAFAIWGLALYWVAGGAYLLEIARALRLKRLNEATP